MANFDSRVDAYIAKSADFAKPILEHLRQLVHRACPKVTESIKWGFPHFEYKGILCNMAAFKHHCSFGFWKATSMKDPHEVMSIIGKTSMGAFNRITSVKDLPSNKILMEYLREAMALNEAQGNQESSKKAPAKSKSAAGTSNELLAALKKKVRSRKLFEAMSPSHQREYHEWILDAKTDPTRDKRIATALDWISEGKSRNWKYIKK